MGKTLDQVRPDLPSINGPLPGPRARAVIERDRRVVSPSYTRSYPLVAARGEGATRGGRGREPLSGFQRRHRGGGHRPLPSASSGGHAGAGRPADPHVGHGFLLRGNGGAGGEAGRNCTRQPARGGYRSATPGAEAIEGAIKLARYATGRDKFIAFYGSFHGRTLGALSLTAQQGGAARGVRAADPGRGSRAVPQLLPLPVRTKAGELRGGVRRVHRKHATEDRRAAGGNRGHRGGTGARRRRLRGAAAEVLRRAGAGGPASTASC